MEFTSAQRRIVDLPAGARAIVDAGPGTGKTAIAAGRALALAASGVDPARVILVTFARAAAAEMRRRLLAMGAHEATLPRVLTLDSLAWRLRADDPEGDALDREGHDAAIAETLAAVMRGDGHVLVRLKALHHLIIDEAQDIVGSRAGLILAMHESLRPDCGVTLFTDEAQAIYGFAGAALAGTPDEGTVAAALNHRPGYTRHTLDTVHRTQDAKLLGLFDSARRIAVSESLPPDAKLARIRRHVVLRSHGPFLRNAKPEGNADTLILYRTRAEVLHAATARLKAGLPVRLRLSGMQPALQPWLADFFAQMGPSLSIEALRALDPDEAEARWALLAPALGGEGARVTRQQALSILTASWPPSELCIADPGDVAGPVIGTIHASKGREMERVKLMLPRLRDRGNDDPDGEARVLFVAATRARARLEIGRGLPLPARRTQSGRAYIQRGATRADVEMGRAGDIHWHKDVALPAYGTPVAFMPDAQGIAVLIDKVETGRAGAGLCRDLMEIGNRLSSLSAYGDAPKSLGHVWVIGAGALPNPKENTLEHRPLVAGLSTIVF